MGLFGEMLRYGLIHHAAKSGTQKAIEKQARKLARQQGPVPFETTVKLRIPVDDDVRPEALSAILSGVEIDVPPGVSIDTIDISASLVDDSEPKKRTIGGSCQSDPPPRFEAVGMSRSAKRHYRDVNRQKRAEERKRQEEDLCATMQSLEEMDAFLKDHTLEEYGQWLLERSQQ